MGDFDPDAARRLFAPPLPGGYDVWRAQRLPGGVVAAALIASGLGLLSLISGPANFLLWSLLPDDPSVMKVFGMSASAMRILGLFQGLLGTGMLVGAVGLFLRRPWAGTLTSIAVVLWTMGVAGPGLHIAFSLLGRGPALLRSAVQLLAGFMGIVAFCLVTAVVHLLRQPAARSWLSRAPYFRTWP